MKQAAFIVFSGAYIFLLAACSSLRESSKYEFQTARYYTSMIPGPGNKVYVEVSEDTIFVHPVKTTANREEVLPQAQNILTENSVIRGKGRYYFYNPSFDIDIITTPLKYRFPTSSLPSQLTTNFNGTAYVGFRNDIFRVRYERTPLNKFERKIQHFGTSIGGFAGIASEPINPWVTNDRVGIEYDGLVLSTGFAWIAGFNTITAGLTVGFDYLLDQNHEYWIYQGRPWLGLAFGINLN